jgi:hypothetical protein
MVSGAPIFARLPDDNYYHPARATVKPQVDEASSERQAVRVPVTISENG